MFAGIMMHRKTLEGVCQILSSIDTHDQVEAFLDLRLELLRRPNSITKILILYLNNIHVLYIFVFQGSETRRKITR